jgi:hypothetical protein
MVQFKAVSGDGWAAAVMAGDGKYLSYHNNNMAYG